MSSSNAPIGIFDSGAGGISVLKELVKILPNESFIYFADSANCPYGPKQPERIIELSNCITKFLLDKGCKTIVVACNTATAAAIDFLRENYKVPFIGMEPAIKPASLNTKTKSITGTNVRKRRNQHKAICCICQRRVCQAGYRVTENCHKKIFRAK